MDQGRSRAEAAAEKAPGWRRHVENLDLEVGRRIRRRRIALG